VAANRLEGIAASRASTAWLSRRSTFGTSWRKAHVPAGGSAVVLLRLLISEEKCELEGFRKADEPEFRGGREGFGDVLAVEGPPEAHVGRALSYHEQMFPCLSTLCKHRGAGLQACAGA
jgi:hypothetical protein